MCLLQVTTDNYKPISSSVNGSGFRPFDMVIPFAFRKGEITGEELMVLDLVKTITNATRTL